MAAAAPWGTCWAPVYAPSALSWPPHEFATFKAEPEADGPAPRLMGDSEEALPVIGAADGAFFST